MILSIILSLVGVTILFYRTVSEPLFIGINTEYLILKDTKSRTRKISWSDVDEINEIEMDSGEKIWAIALKSNQEKISLSYVEIGLIQELSNRLKSIKNLDGEYKSTIKKESNNDDNYNRIFPLLFLIWILDLSITVFVFFFLNNIFYDPLFIIPSSFVTFSLLVAIIGLKLSKPKLNVS
jgi:hypothetical protein